MIVNSFMYHKLSLFLFLLYILNEFSIVVDKAEEEARNFPSIKNNRVWVRKNNCCRYKCAAARVGKLFLDSIIFFSDFFFASRSISFSSSILTLPSSPHHQQPFVSWEFFPLSFDFFYVFLPPLFFSFHSNENHLNIIVIFFLLVPFRRKNLLIPFIQLHLSFHSDIHVLAHHSYYNTKWMDFLHLFHSCSNCYYCSVVKEFMASDLLYMRL